LAAEGLWDTAQDRLVKELRLAEAKTMDQANGVLEGKFLPWFNRRCTVRPASGNDAHRPFPPSMDLAAILSLRRQRTVADEPQFTQSENLPMKLSVMHPLMPLDRGLPTAIPEGPKEQSPVRSPATAPNAHRRQRSEAA
jgi:hypothetical protein